MPKNLFQDMVKVKSSKKPVLQKEIRKEAPTYPDIKQIRHRDEKRSHGGVWFVAIVSIIFFIFALSFLFGRATITINPKIKDVTLNENLSAIKDLNQSGLAFDLVIISGTETKPVVGGVEEEVALPSQGTVFIYNTFSAVPQKLAINTKLEGSNGKTYQTSEAVVVPGVNADGTAGSVQVGITGIEAGEEYNSGPIDFKIAGFKGTSKYDKFYGRSQGSITGGFKGLSATISEADKEVAFAELKNSLQAKLFQKASDQIPSGFILFKDAAFLTIEEQNVEFASGSSTVPVTVKGTLYGFLLNEKNLTQKIAKDNIPSFDDTAEVYIPNIRELTFNLSDKDVVFSDVQSINFNLSGSAKIVWKFDDATLKESLLGKHKNEFEQILAQYPNIDSAQLALSPFWIRSIPSKLKDIKVIVNYPVVNSI